MLNIAIFVDDNVGVSPLKALALTGTLRSFDDGRKIIMTTDKPVFKNKKEEDAFHNSKTYAVFITDDDQHLLLRLKTQDLKFETNKVTSNKVDWEFSILMS
jgi:hypothetical protein